MSPALVLYYTCLLIHEILTGTHLVISMHLIMEGEVATTDP